MTTPCEGIQNPVLCVTIYVPCFTVCNLGRRFVIVFNESEAFPSLLLHCRAPRVEETSTSQLHLFHYHPVVA